MSREQAQGSQTKRALVLGPASVAGLLAEELKRQGFECELQEASGVPLPNLADPNGLTKLRQILANFAHAHDPKTESLWVHPGISVWSERPELPVLTEELGLTAISPPVRVLSLFSNKLSFLFEADGLGIPTLVLSPDPIQSIREIEQLISDFSTRISGGKPSLEAVRQPFPFVLKSVKGESNLRLQVIHNFDDVEKNLPLWLEQLRRNSGEVILFAERYVEGARHMIVPFARFQDGRFEVFPTVEASLQSRFRKVMEVCPADSIEPEVEKKLHEWTRKMADHTNFVGVGVMEYFVDGGRAFLVEGSARLNTEFHLWEKVAGTEVVSWQLATMGIGEPKFATAEHAEWKYGIALRLYAEDSILQLPQPGTVHELSTQRHWEFPSAEAELSLSVDEGGVIAPLDYGMIGSIWVGAKDRKQALTVARGVLGELWIAGTLQTNERFLSELLAHPWVREGVFHAGFVDEEFIASSSPPNELIPLFAALCAESLGAAPLAEGERAGWFVAGRLPAPEPKSDTLAWTETPRRWALRSGHGDAVSGTLQLPDGRKLRAAAFPLVAGRWQARIGLWNVTVRRVVKKEGVKPKPRILALVPGKVDSILFRADAIAPAHESILILESLRMLIPHALPADVRITEWKVRAGDMVELGQELAEFEIVKK